MFDIWSKNEPLAEKIYSGNNYKIIENPDYPENRCILYFSSNDIWFPNTEEAFRRSFVENDYYEWTRHGARFGRKAIFFRDIYKSWYTTGISSTLSGISALLEFIKKETEGMELICVGSSAGGYMATLAGSILGAKVVLAFSAQFDLCLEDGSLLRNPILSRYLVEEEYSRYYRLKEFVENSVTSVYYMMPARNTEDLKQYEYMKDVPNVKTLKLGTHRHGVPVIRENVERMLSLSKGELDFIFDAFREKEVSRISFSAYLCGWRHTIVFAVNELWRQIRKKLRGKR